LPSTKLANGLLDGWMKSLISELRLPNAQWAIQMVNSNLGMCKLSCVSSQEIAVIHSVVITPTCHWTLVVRGRHIDQSKCSLLKSIPIQLSIQTLQSMLSLLDACNICAGHPEEDYVRMAESRKGKLLSLSGNTVVAYVDTLPLVLEGKVFEKTIQSSSCEILVKGKKCSACVSFHGTLRKSYHHWKKQMSSSLRNELSTFSKTNFRFLNTPEKKIRYSNLRARYDSMYETPNPITSPLLCMHTQGKKLSLVHIALLLKLCENPCAVCEQLFTH